MPLFLKKITTALCLSVCVLYVPAHAQQAPQSQIYIARGESPRAVMANLLGLYGRELRGGEFSSRPVSGRFDVSSVEEVMAYFERAYNISWFEFGPTIYLYRPSDWTTSRLYVGDYDVSTKWDELLKKSGLQQKKFSVFYSPQQNELVVSGPRTYIQLVRSTFEVERPAKPADTKTPAEVKEPEFMVFPLKYASVEDRTIKLRGKEYVTPGAFTVLRNLLGGAVGGNNQIPIDEDAYGFKGVQLGVMANPGTALKAAGEVVRKSVRGEEPSGSSFFPNGVPSLTSNRNPNDPTTNINVPVPKNAMFGGGGGSLFADNRTNSIVVKDSPDKYGFYKSLIDKLDVPVAMIEVEAMLVEIDSSSLNQLGMEFGIKGSGGFRFDFPGVDTRNLNGQAVLGSSSIVDPAKFIARLKALASDSQAKVLSRPTIVTQDNVPAFIDLSETLFLQLQGERVAQVEPVTAGSLLQVTPRLVEGENSSEIFISVEIQDGALQRNGENSNPSVRNTTLSTQALIDRDKAILIGGYNRESQTEVENKIPVLGGIPFIGKMFSSSERSTQNFVRLFLITPKVLTEPRYFAESTRKAVEQVKSKFKLEGSALEAPPPVQVYKLDPKLSLGK